jgi:hypothetical protein
LLEFFKHIEYHNIQWLTQCEIQKALYRWQTVQTLQT